MFSQLGINELVDVLTYGSLCDKKMLSITSNMVNSNMTSQEAINEQLDIIFDDVLLTNPGLGKNRDLLEKSLREVGITWRSQLERS